MAAIAIAGVGIPLAVLGAVAFGLAVWAGDLPPHGRPTVSECGRIPGVAPAGDVRQGAQRPTVSTRFCGALRSRLTGYGLRIRIGTGTKRLRSTTGSAKPLREGVPVDDNLDLIVYEREALGTGRDLVQHPEPVVEIGGEADPREIWDK